MKWSQKVLILITLICILAGCGSSGDLKITRYDNVEQVLMHEAGRYTIIYNSHKELLQVSIYVGYMGRIRLFKDVPSDQPMWAIIKTQEYYDRGDDQWAEIHLHNGAEVNGAGWNHGKGGNGQTNSLLEK